MKNSNPVQFVILIIALLLVYNALQTVPYFIWLFYRWVADGLTFVDTFQNMAINFLFIAFYVIIAAVLIKKSDYLSEKITEGAPPAFGINISVNKADIFHMTLLAMGGYILLTRLPKLLVKVYAAIKEKNAPEVYDGPNYVLPGDSTPEFVIIIIMAIILISYAKPLTNYFVGPDEDNTAIEEIGTKTPEK